MGSSIFMHDTTNLEDEFLRIKSEQDKLFDSLSKEIQKIIAGWRSTSFDQQEEYFKNLTLKEKVKLVKYQPIEKKARLFGFLKPEEKGKIVKSLPREDQRIVSAWLSWMMKENKDKEELEDFFKKLDSEKQVTLFKYLPRVDKKKVFKYLKDSKELVIFFKSLPFEEQVKFFKSLEAEEQATFFTFLEPEDKESFFEHLDDANEQSKFFNSLELEKQVRLLASLNEEKQAILFASLDEETQEELFNLLEQKEQPTSRGLESKVDPLQSMSLEERVRHFNSLEIDERVKLFLQAEEQVKLYTSLEQKSKTTLFKAMEAEQQNPFFNSLGFTEQIKIFEHLKDSKEQYLYFKSLEPKEQGKALVSLDVDKKVTLFESMLPEEKVKLFVSLEKEDKHDFFKSLDTEVKIWLFTNSVGQIWLFDNLEEQLSLFHTLTREEQQRLLKFMRNELAYFKQIQSNIKRLDVLKNSGAKIEADLEHFYSYQFHHPRFLQIVIVILGIAAMGLSFNYTLQFFNKKPVEPMYTKIAGIKRLGEMHLVKQQYESVIPITKQKLNKKDDLKKENLQFLLIAPIEVTGYIDFGRLELEVNQEDSIMQIELPQAYVSKAYLDFARTEEYKAEGRMRVFGKRIERVNHREAYIDIARGINNAKDKVRESAAKEHEILEETQEKAQTFLRNFASTLGYRVEFKIIPETTTPLADTTATPTAEDGNGIVGSLVSKGKSLLQSN